MRAFGWLLGLMLLVVAARPSKPVPVGVDIGVRATSSNQTQPQFVERAVVFDANTYDTDAIHDVSGGATANFMVHTAGKYQFSCNYYLGPILGGATVFFYARRNGGELEHVEVAETPGLALAISLSGENQFAAGDVVQFSVFDIAGGVTSIRANAFLRKVD